MVEVFIYLFLIQCTSAGRPERKQIHYCVLKSFILCDNRSFYLCFYSSRVRNILPPETQDTEDRETEVSDAVIEKACSSLSSTGVKLPILSKLRLEFSQRFFCKGFINYYGTQRFGTGDIPTYEVYCIVIELHFSRSKYLFFLFRLARCWLRKTFQRRLSWFLHQGWIVFC